MGIRTVLIFLLCTLALFAQKIDTQLLSKSRYLEHVQVSNGTDYFIYLQHQEEEVSLPSLSFKKIDISPKWHFYTKVRKPYIIAVASLSENNHYLNTAYFNTMKLTGSCNECQIALADKRLFDSEDNYIIGSFQQKIDLDLLRDKIDLRHLKYLVILADQRADINITSVSFLNDFTHTKHEKKQRAVWVWNEKDIDMDLLKKHHIRRVYLQIRKGFERAAKELYDKGFEVYGLDGDPQHIFDDTQLLNDLKRIETLNRKEPIVTGFQIDVEPHVLPDFNLNKTDHIQRLATLVKRLSTLTHHHKIALSVVTPFWYDNIYFQKRPLIYTIIDLSDQVVLMSYRSDPATVLQISADELSYASYRHKSIAIGIELMKIPDEKHTLFSFKEEQPCIVSGDLISDCRLLVPQQHYTVKGSKLSFYGQSPEHLQKLLKYHIPYPAFEGFVFNEIQGLQ